MLLWLLLFPLLSYLSTNLLGRYIGIYGSCILASFSIFMSFVCSIVAFYECSLTDSVCTIFLNTWINTELFISNWGFYFDPLSTTMLLVVTGVSSLVHLYSTEYMSSDPHQGRFMGYLSLFTFFMLVLVTADNFLVMFLGWEGIGLASFLLISFWTNRIQAGKSAIKAMLVNRVGDLGLSLGICAIFLTYKTIDYSIVFALAPESINFSFSFLSFEIDRISLIDFLLFWGALGKSAQLGLHIWLPDAMEGPTPVSALIHAATLVTAGVFLIIRCSLLFELSNSTLLIVSMFGALTAFFAGTVGLVQNDLKRVIAYSTCSQLGYMVFAAGLSHYSVSLFHLANHALFKALLFLSAGAIIHGLLDEQDLRKMGNLLQTLPMSYTMILIGSLALVGFPFLTGFYSKDVILEIALSKPGFSGNFAHWLGSLAALCTSFYSFRLIFLVFINRSNSFKIYIENVHDAPIRMAVPLFVLGFGSIFWGYFSKDLFIGLGTPIYLNNIFILPSNLIAIDSEFANAFLKNLPFIFTIFGALLSWLLINCHLLNKKTVYNLKISKIYRNFYSFLSQKWGFDQIFTELITNNAMNFGYKTSFKTIDKGNIEIFGPFGMSAVISVYSEILTFLSSGFVFHYSFLIMLSIVLIIFNYVFILSFAINSMVFLCLFFAYLAFISKIA
jgi:NADH-ubiquinone oxidoreductase chain 5